MFSKRYPCLQHPPSADTYPADKLMSYRPVSDIPYRMSS